MADAARQVEESQKEVALVKEQLAAVLDYKQRKEVLEEEVAKLQADSAKFKTDTAQQVWDMSGLPSECLRQWLYCMHDMLMLSSMVHT